MKTTLLFTMSVWLLPLRTGQEPQSDWLLVPGERVGPVRANTSEADLQRLFGRADVVPTTFPIGEGEQRPGTIVFPNDSSLRLEILWRDTLARKEPEEVRLRGLRSRWRFANGVTLGSSLRDLERLNGRPFQLSGWEHDGAGIVYGWAGGALESQLPNRGVRVYLAAPSSSLLTRSERASLAGDHPLMSDNLSLRKANPGIAFVRIFFSP